jgi:hypothetical protein
MAKITFEEKQKYLKKVLKFLAINSKVVLKIRKIGDKLDEVDGKVIERNKPHKIFVIFIDKDCRNWKRVILHECIHIVHWHSYKTMTFVNKKLDKKANELSERQVEQWVRLLYKHIE